MATGEQLPGSDELDDDQREAVELQLRRLADDEFVHAERYTEWQVRAPTLESDLALSNIAQDELGHARLWYDLLMDFGYDEADLVWERDPERWHHSTLVERPFESGDWADPIVRGYLYDVAEDLRLAAVAGSSYEPIANRVEKIRREEEYHREHAQNWLERLTGSEEGRERVQAAVDRQFPYALTLFDPSEALGDRSESSNNQSRGTDPDLETRIDDLGVRTSSLRELRENWLDRVLPFFDDLGVETPLDDTGDVSEEVRPGHSGRDGEHTEDWHTLYEEFTRTYQVLGRDGADRIMEDPDDVE